jgi:hypothetical protein
MSTMARLYLTWPKHIKLRVKVPYLHCRSQDLCSDLTLLNIHVRQVHLAVIDHLKNGYDLGTLEGILVQPDSSKSHRSEKWLLFGHTRRHLSPAEFLSPRSLSAQKPACAP